jgi:hypothetical protein
MQFAMFESRGAVQRQGICFTDSNDPVLKKLLAARFLRVKGLSGQIFIESSVVNKHVNI